MAKATTGGKTASKATSTKASATKTAKPKAAPKTKVKAIEAKPKRVVAKAVAAPKSTTAKATKAKATSNADLMAIAKAAVAGIAKPKVAGAKATKSRAVSSKGDVVALRAKATAEAFAATRVNALAAAQFAIEKKAENVRLLELKDVTSITDFFVVCSADTDRQVKAIAENVIVEMRDTLGQQPWRSEGWDTLRWVIIDFVDFVVHVLQSESRLYYNIERLWADAPSELIEDNTVKPKRATKKKATSDEDAASKTKKRKIRVIKDLDAE